MISATSTKGSHIAYSQVDVCLLRAGEAGTQETGLCRDQDRVGLRLRRNGKKAFIQTEDQFNRLKTEGKKPEQRTDLHIGTVVAQGKKGNNKEFHEVAENPKRNPQTANNNYNYNYSPPKQHKPQTAQQNNQQPPQDNGLWNVMGQLLMNKKGPPNNHHQGTNQGNVPRTANHGWDM